MYCADLNDIFFNLPLRTHKNWGRFVVKNYTSDSLTPPNVLNILRMKNILEQHTLGTLSLSFSMLTWPKKGHLDYASSQINDLREHFNSLIAQNC